MPHQSGRTLNRDAAPLQLPIISGPPTSCLPQQTPPDDCATTALLDRFGHFASVCLRQPFFFHGTTSSEARRARVLTTSSPPLPPRQRTTTDFQRSRISVVWRACTCCCACDAREARRLLPWRARGITTFWYVGHFHMRAGGGRTVRRRRERGGQQRRRQHSYERREARKIVHCHTDTHRSNYSLSATQA